MRLFYLLLIFIALLNVQCKNSASTSEHSEKDNFQPIEIRLSDSVIVDYRSLYQLQKEANSERAVEIDDRTSKYIFDDTTFVIFYMHGGAGILGYGALLYEGDTSKPVYSHYKEHFTFIHHDTSSVLTSYLSKFNPKGVFGPSLSEHELSMKHLLELRASKRIVDSEHIKSIHKFEKTWADSLILYPKYNTIQDSILTLCAPIYHGYLRTTTNPNFLFTRKGIVLVKENKYMWVHVDNLHTDNIPDLVYRRGQTLRNVYYVSPSRLFIMHNGYHLIDFELGVKAILGKKFNKLTRRHFRHKRSNPVLRSDTVINYLDTLSLEGYYK